MNTNHQSMSLKRVVELLSPSAMSSVICVVASLILALGVTFISHYQSSSLKLQYLYYQSHYTISGGHLVGSLLKNSFINDLPLLLFWIIVGIVIYLIAVDIVRTVQAVFELRKELEYKHVHRGVLIRGALEQFLIRIVVIAIWLPYLFLFFHHLIPYCVTVAIVATTSGSAVLVPAYIALSVLVASVGLHVNVVLARALFLRRRLIGSVIN